MKHLKSFTVVAGLVMLSFFAKGQDSLLYARLKATRGMISPFSLIAKKDSLFLICFWSTKSDESISELNAINAKWDLWKTQIPFRFLAVSIDEGKAANQVRPVSLMNEWKFDVFTDIYGELRRTLNANNLPQAMIIYKNKLIYQQSGYSSGTENYLMEKMIAVGKGNF